MRYSLTIKPAAQKKIDSIPQLYRTKILNALVYLETDPYLGKKLKGDLKDLYSLRVWPYRIVYKVYKNILIIVVINVAHRQGVY